MPLEHRETQDWLGPGGPTCLRPNPTPHCLPPAVKLSSASGLVHALLLTSSVGKISSSTLPAPHIWLVSGPCD
uniref:Uncharacterized protein n=1 Tax=Mesocestoides corti TaxID=53468 RepID=A0A5K3FW23_MESCO